MKISTITMLLFPVFSLLAQQSQVVAHHDPLVVSTDERVVMQNNFFDDSYLDLTRERSNLAEVVEDISFWDEDKDSPIWHLYKHITDGHSVALRDVVLETLAYAESIVQKKSKTLSQDQLEHINESLDALVRKINNGELNNCCQIVPHSPLKIRQKLYVLNKAKFFECVTFKNCVEFEECLENLCVDNLVVNNCMSDLCVNTLSVVDVSVSGLLSVNEAIIGNLDIACDLVVGCNLMLNDSINPSVGNVVKNGRRFGHTYPAGSENTFVGENAGNFTSTGTENTGFGFEVLEDNTTGFSNVGKGWSALTSNTTGSRNVGVGHSALRSNITGLDNTGVGNSALEANTVGERNVAVGSSAMLVNTTGIRNTSVGVSAMQNNTTGSFNVGVGQAALINNITGDNNVAIGDNAWSSGSENVMIGANSGNNGSRNIGIGFQTLVAVNSDRNVAVGYNSMGSSIVNGDNTALGYQALRFVRGSFNIGIGSGAGQGSSLATSNNNIYVANAGINESGAIRIGTNGTHTTCFIQGISGATTGLAAIPVLVDANGQLGTISSSATRKHDIRDMKDVSSVIYKLRPVTFAFNGDKTEAMQYGLIAEEVEQVFPAIVVKGADGKPYSVQYHVLPVLLLNELIKQKEEFSAAIERVNNRLMALEQSIK